MTAALDAVVGGAARCGGGGGQVGDYHDVDEELENGERYADADEGGGCVGSAVSAGCWTPASATGKAVKAGMSGAAPASNSATWAKGYRSCATTQSDWARTFAGDSCR